MKEGMKDQNAPSGVTSAVAPTFIPVLAPMRRRPMSWTRKRRLSAARRSSVSRPCSKQFLGVCKGGMGQRRRTNNIGGKVLGEAILSGSTKLPATTSDASGPGPAYTGNDPN